jgi:hypothetical protein
MTSNKKNQPTYGGRKNQSYNQQDRAVFEQNGMTEAGVLFHFTFLKRLTKICTVPNRRTLNEVWMEPRLVTGFQERFVETSLSEEVSLPYKLTQISNIDVTTLGTKCQRALQLLEMLLGNDLIYVNRFVEMNLATQIALIDALVGLEAIAGTLKVKTRL